MAVTCSVFMTASLASTFGSHLGENTGGELERKRGERDMLGSHDRSHLGENTGALGEGA